VPTNSKRPARYDLKKHDRRRNLLVQLGLTAVVVVFAVALVLYIVMSHAKKPTAGEAKSIRVASSKLITKDGSTEPKVVLSFYEDFLCPHCGKFEKDFGPTVNQLIDTGAVAADYTMVSIFNAPQFQTFSARSGAAAYCVADVSTDAFRRFHAAMFAQQPNEQTTSFPDNARLIEIAREAGAGGSVPDCINSEKYVPMVQGMAAAAKITATPTVKINGEEFPITEQTTPDQLLSKVKSIVGNVPGLETPAAPAPASQ
jgi:protein-disulfide isomerase